MRAGVLQRAAADRLSFADAIDRCRACAASRQPPLFAPAQVEDVNVLVPVRPRRVKAIRLPSGAVSAGPAMASGGGIVYTLSTSPSGNSVLAFERAFDGSLNPAESIASGGLGTGGGLGSQGAIILAENGRWLFAVNAGSNSISSFAVRHGGLDLAQPCAIESTDARKAPALIERLRSVSRQPW